MFIALLSGWRKHYMHSKTLHIYYTATPVFFVLYYFFDINLRISIPGASDYWLYSYYLVCFIASFIVFKNITTGAIFALIESSINIFLLMLSVLTPILNFGLNPENSSIVFGMPELIHFIIAMIIFSQSFYLNPIILKSRDI